MTVARPHRPAARAFMPSIDHRGYPPLIENESVLDMAAGRGTARRETFTLRHFRFVDDEGGMAAGWSEPPHEVWVTAERIILVQGGVGGYMQTWYERSVSREATREGNRVPVGTSRDHPTPAASDGRGIMSGSGICQPNQGGRPEAAVEDSVRR